MTRRHSKNEWSGGIAAHPPRPPQKKKFRVQKSAGKVLACIFLGSRRYPSIDYLPKGQTINVEYYPSLIVQLKDILNEKRDGKITKAVLFLHDKAPAHRTLATQKKMAYLGFQCLDHPPYSPDLAPSDYHLFPGLKKQLKCRHFSSDAEVIPAREIWLDGQTSEFFLSSLQKLEQRAKKCIKLCENYVEQIPSLVAVACFLPGRAKDLSAPPHVNTCFNICSVVRTHFIQSLWAFLKG